MIRRIGIFYKENFAGALALMARLEKEIGELKRHSIYTHSYAFFKNGSYIEVYPLEFDGTIRHRFNEVYVDRFATDEEYNLCQAFVDTLYADSAVIARY